MTKALIWLQQGRRRLWVSLLALFALFLISFSVTTYVKEGSEGLVCSFVPCAPEVIDAGTGESFTAIEIGKSRIGNSGTIDTRVERYYLSDDAFRMVNSDFMELILLDGKAWQKKHGEDWTQIAPSQAKALWGGNTPSVDEMLRPTTTDGFTRERVGSGPRTSTGETTSVIRTENRRWGETTIATMEEFKTQYPDAAAGIADLQESHQGAVLRGEFVVGDETGHLYTYKITGAGKDLSLEIEGTRRYGPVTISAPR